MEAPPASAQGLATARDLEPIAYEIATAAADTLGGGQTVSTPTEIRPTSLGDLTLDGLASGWIFDYLPTGGDGEHYGGIRVTVDANGNASSQLNGDYIKTPLPVGWLDTPAIIEAALSAPLGDSGWSAQVLLDTYADAAIVQFAALTTRNSYTFGEPAPWSLVTRSDSCDIDLEVHLDAAYGWVISSTSPSVPPGACPGSDAEPPEEPEPLDPARYGPYGIGDVWTYEKESISASTSTCPSMELVGFEQAAILRDTTINSELYRIATCQSFDVTGAPVGTNIVAVRSGEDGRARQVDVLKDGGGCHFPSPNVSSGYNETPGQAEVEIGGTTLTVDGVLDQLLSGRAGSSDYRTWTYAADIGLLSYRYHVSRRSAGGDYCKDEALRLVYANVGGVEVGEQVVPVETTVGPPPAVPASLAVTVFPQPTGGDITVRIPHVAHAHSIRVEMLDALGRRVRAWEGTPSLERRLDLDGLPSGLYYVRVTAGDLAGSARVVRL